MLALIPQRSLAPDAYLDVPPLGTYGASHAPPLLQKPFLMHSLLPEECQQWELPAEAHRSPPPPQQQGLQGVFSNRLLF